MPTRPTLGAMVEANASGMLLVGVTPPRRSATPAQIRQIAEVTTARLAPLDLDGLVLYDIDDESDRNRHERPFAYLPTMDPAVYHSEYLDQLNLPAVIYRCVGKYQADQLTGWMRSVDPDQVLTVFVGASSAGKPVLTQLPAAYQLRQSHRPRLRLGGVAIGERYAKGQDEHLRLLAKQERGVSFFISQVVYDVDTTKSLLSDYAYTCAERGVQPRPILLTLSVCGSLKTLDFMRWLGIGIPRWLDNALRHAADPLVESYQQCLTNAADLAGFCHRLGLPFGFNVESVSIRKVEIDAAMELAREVRGILDRELGGAA